MIYEPLTRIFPFWLESLTLGLGIATLFRSNSDLIPMAEGRRKNFVLTSDPKRFGEMVYDS